MRAAPALLALALAAPALAQSEPPLPDAPPPDLLLACKGTRFLPGGSVLNDSPMQFRLAGGIAEVYVPEHSRYAAVTGEWRKVRKLKIGAEVISGQVKNWLIGYSQFTIDRRSGVVSVLGGYEGHCVSLDPNTRAF